MAYIKPQPLLRTNTQEEIKHAIMRLFERNRVGYPYKNCLNCKNWDFGKDICKKYGARPPTEIIVYSCAAHEDNDDIPF